MALDPYKSWLTDLSIGSRVKFPSAYATLAAIWPGGIQPRPEEVKFYLGGLSAPSREFKATKAWRYIFQWEDRPNQYIKIPNTPRNQNLVLPD